MEDPFGTMNAVPMFSVSLIMAICSGLASYVLSVHVVDAVDNIGVFIVGSYVVFSSYFVFHYFLDMLSSSYRAINKEKQFYVLSNLIKSGILCSVTPFAFYLLKETIMNDIWSTNKIRNLGTIYAIPDFVSLILVRKMSWATVFHHVCVVIFNTISLYNDYDKENICRLIMVYAIFSTFAYAVNLLLGFRFLGVSDQVAAVLSFGSFVIYGSCCLINWSWQVYYIKHLIYANNHWSIYVYCVLIGLVIYDDIILNKWLLQNVLSGSKPRPKKADNHKKE